MKPLPALFLVSLSVTAAFGCGRTEPASESAGSVPEPQSGPVQPNTIRKDEDSPKPQRIIRKKYHVQMKGSKARWDEMKPTPEQVRKSTLRQETGEKARQSKAEGDLSNAELQLKTYLREYPEDKFATKDIADVFLRAGKFSEAYKAYKSVIGPIDGSRSTMTFDPVLLVGFGEAALELNKKSEAEQAFAAAVKGQRFRGGDHLPKADPIGTDFVSTRAGAHVAAAFKLYFSSGVEEAAHHFAKAVEICPKYDGARFYLAKTLCDRRLGRNKEAIAEFEKLSDNPDEMIRTQSRKQAQRLKYMIDQLPTK